jgi:hypothetical protein
LDEFEARRKFAQLDAIGVRGNCAFGAEHRHASLRERGLCLSWEGPWGQAGEGFYGRPHDAENPPVRAMPGKMLLLNVSEGTGRGGVTGENNDGAALIEEPFDRFEGIAVNDVEAARSVGCTGTVREKEEVVLGKRSDEGAHHRESSKAGIKNTDHAPSDSIRQAPQGKPLQNLPPRRNQVRKARSRTAVSVQRREDDLSRLSVSSSSSSW